MPLFIAALLGGLINIAGTIAGRVMIALGISVATYSGFAATLTWFKNMAFTNIQALPPEVVGMLGLMKVGVCVSMVVSAYAARLALSGLTGDTMKKWVGK